MKKKTASLFETSCTIGAICAQKNHADITNFAKFGKNIGIAFQIIDDLIGILGDSKITKKPVGNDLREGKKSLPIIMAINRSRGKNKEEIMQVFGNTNSTKAELEKAVKTIHKMKIDTIVRNQAMNYSNLAKKMINKYKGSTKNELIKFLDFYCKKSIIDVR